MIWKCTDKWKSEYNVDGCVYAGAYSDYYIFSNKTRQYKKLKILLQYPNLLIWKNKNWVSL